MPFFACRSGYKSPTGNTRGQSDGFSLLEIMIVLAIIVIIAGFASSGGIRNWLTQRGLSTAVEQLRSDLQKTKALAIKEHANCSLNINTPAVNQYTITLNNQVVDLGVYRGNVVFEAASDPGITFTPWGSCTAAAQFQMTNQANTSLFRLRISAAGGISKQVWNGAKWVPSGT